MKRHIYYILIFFIACGVKQPVDMGQNLNLSSGSLYIASQPTGASIFIDNILQPNTTPDTLHNIPTGLHYIKVFKQGYRSQTDSVAVHVKKDSLHTINFVLQEIIYKSYLHITSEPAGAAIYLDGQNTGLRSPDTLEVEPAKHTISLVKNGFETVSREIDARKDVVHTLSAELPIFQRVLFEAFGNVACDPCVESAENLERFLAEHRDGPYALFEYYANWPAANDPFYATAPQDVNERVNYYTAYSLPTLKLNGSVTVDAQNYDKIVADFNSALEIQKTELAISLEKEREDNLLNVSLILYDRADILSNTDLRLFVAIVEDSLYYENTGGNGLTHFNFVFRRFLSSKIGDIISADHAEYSLDWPGGWNYANSKIIAFIQDVNTKKIVQTTLN